MRQFVEKLKMLRQEIPEPFSMTRGLQEFYGSTIAQQLIADEEATIDNILEYLKKKPDPFLVVPAILLLAYFEPERFYKRLLKILGILDRSTIEALEHGLWRVKLDERIIARDLIELVNVTENQYLLLLLQRPIIREFKNSLEAFIESRKNPLSLYAMYSYKYVGERRDKEFLKKVSQWNTTPAVAALAKEYLQELK